MPDVTKSIQYIQKRLKIPSLVDSTKVNYCQLPNSFSRNIESAPSVSRAMCLANSASINDSLIGIKASFQKMHKRKAMLHHYTKYCDESLLKESLENAEHIIDCYQ